MLFSLSLYSTAWWYNRVISRKYWESAHQLNANWFSVWRICSQKPMAVWTESLRFLLIQSRTKKTDSFHFCSFKCLKKINEIKNGPLFSFNSLRKAVINNSLAFLITLRWFYKLKFSHCIGSILYLLFVPLYLTLLVFRRRIFCGYFSLVSRTSQNEVH